MIRCCDNQPQPSKGRLTSDLLLLTALLDLTIFDAAPCRLLFFVEDKDRFSTLMALRVISRIVENDQKSYNSMHVIDAKRSLLCKWKDI